MTGNRKEDLKAAKRVTMVLDRLSGLVREEFEQAAEYVDILEIGWGLPLVWKEEALTSRIKYYQKLGVKVSMSGTLVEHAIYHGSTESILKKAEKLGFDIIEVSDGIIDMSLEQKERLVKSVKQHDFEYLIAVGKKDPASQLSHEETIARISDALTLEPIKVVLEGREAGRVVGIYDENGNVRWNFLRAITSRLDPKEIIFEAPNQIQQAALIQELGPDVNLGNVSLNSIAALESERQGLRFDTFGVDIPHRHLSGGPSVKFVFFVIKANQPIDQRQIVSMTQLPRRTVQKALDYLLKNKLVTEHSSFSDRRIKVYSSQSAPPLWEKK
jgi:phosphosulfolactate synthase